MRLYSISVVSTSKTLSNLWAGDRVSVLTVLCDPQARTALLQLLSHSNWNVHSLSSFEEAVPFLHTSTAGVVVAQYGASGRLSWRDLLEETSRLAAPPRLVVTDRLADDSMWAEVLNLGAHDLLSQPFESREVFHVLSCAWQSWKNGSNHVRGDGAPQVVRGHAA